MKNSGERSVPETKRSRGLRGAFSLRTIWNLIIIAAIGILAGNQIASPKKRIIEAVVGLTMVLVLWNFSTFAALSFIILMYPFPFGTSLGSSDFILVILITIIYLIRVSARLETIRSDRFFNLSVGLLCLSFILSLYNIGGAPDKVRMVYFTTTNFFTAVILFYLIINFINTEERLERTLKLMMVTNLLTILFTVYEMRYPGTTIIPGWLVTRHRVELIMKEVRMGGPFLDFELYGEFLALNMQIVFLMIIRTRRLATRFLYTLLLMADFFMLLTTITRGAFITLSIGIVYLMILSRRDLNFVRLFAIVLVLLTTLFAMEYIVSNYTISGSILERLSTTKFKGGIPDTRYGAWHNAWSRAMEHPFIGHAPGWDFSKGLTTEYWPHNVYLYTLNITGLFGLITFLYLLYKLVRATLPGVRNSLVSSSFAGALQKVLHVCLVMFIIDEIKIEYLRNIHYVFFVWLFFGLIAATRRIVAQQTGSELSPLPMRRDLNEDSAT